MKIAVNASIKVFCKRPLQLIKHVKTYDLNGEVEVEHESEIEAEIKRQFFIQYPNYANNTPSKTFTFEILLPEIIT